MILAYHIAVESWHKEMLREAKACYAAMHESLAKVPAIMNVFGENQCPKS